MLAPVIAVFVVTLGVIVGVYWLLVERPEVTERSDLQKRLRGVSIASTVSRAGGTLVRAEEKLSSLPFLDRLLRSYGQFVEPLRQTLSLADLRFSVGVLVLSMLCAGMAVFVVVNILVGVWWIAVVAGLLFAWVPIAYVRFAARRRMYQFEEQFPEAIDLIARALRAGHAFTTGLAMVGEEAPQPMAAEFKKLYDMQNFGMPLPEAMREFAARIPILDAKFFVTAVLTQRESGGNLAEVLDNLASVIRDRFKVKRQVRVITAHARITGLVLICLPPFLAAGFMITAPTHLSTLLGDPLGHYMIGGAIALQATGTLIIRKLIQVEY
jgi:tight adherence protein B